MATLRQLSQIVSGLYRNSRTGHASQREKLLDQLPPSMLDRQVHRARPR
jgi:hypothetical protein